MVPYVEQSDVARVVLGLGVAAFVLGELTQVVRARRGGAIADLRAEVVFRVLFIGAILLLPAGRAVAPGAVIGGGVWVFTLGAALGWSGLLLRWWSFVTLGVYFSIVLRTSVSQPVVDRGPYRLLRHPSYTGLLLAFIGSGLMVGNWLGAAASVGLLTVALVARIRIEERALDAALGDRYRGFATGRPRLVPFVW